MSYREIDSDDNAPCFSPKGLVLLSARRLQASRQRIYLINGKPYWRYQRVQKAGKLCSSYFHCCHMTGMVIAVQSPRTTALTTLDGLNLVEVTAEVDARLDDCVPAGALKFPLAQLCA